jgi:hypothetical protein
VPVAADLHDEFAALGGAAGQRPGDFQVPPFDQDRLPEHLLRTARMLPAVEDLGHAPADTQLQMLDALGFQATAGWWMAEPDPGDDTATRLAHPFDCLTSSGRS